ncbi:MAG: adenylate/guanylate cyclase domain-containing protein [Spirochaetota bacterium]
MANSIKFKKGKEEKYLFYNSYKKIPDLNRNKAELEKELMIDRMSREGIKTCLVVYSGNECKDICGHMISIYKKHGIEMITLYFQFRGTENYKLIKKAADNLLQRLGKQNCILLSFDDNKLLHLFIVLFFINIKKSPLQAVSTARHLSTIGKYAGFEEKIINGFYRYFIAHSVKDNHKHSAPKPWNKKNESPEDVSGSDRTENTNGRDKKILPVEDREKFVIVNGNGKPAEGLKIHHVSFSTVLHWLGLFRQSIQFKLMLIVSGLLTSAMLVMILLATHFFKSDNETRVQENNLNISTIMADKIKTDILAVAGKAKSIALTSFQEGGLNRETGISADLLIKDEKDFVYVGLAKRVNHIPSVRSIKGIINSSYIEGKGLRGKDLEVLSLTREKLFSRSYNSEIIVANLSREIRSPLLALSFPFEIIKGSVESVLLVYINPNRLIKNFSSSGITETFLVNLDGDVLAHTDANLLLMNTNFLNSPIIKKMLSSTIDNGQTRYRGEDNRVYLGSFKKVGIGGLGIVSTVPEAKAFEEVYNIQKRNIYILLIILNISILAVFFFSKTMTKPIIELVGETEKIKNGNYNVRLKPRTKDEIGILTDSFADMSKGLQERERIKTAFGKFVNPEIAEMAMHQEMQLGGEKKNAVVMFCDIRSFTAISESLSPEHVVEFLNNYLTRMVQCINDNFGVVDKFIGDAIMAVWGTPVSSGNDIQNAVHSSLQMRYQLELFNMDRGIPGKPVIKMGCGINAGPVIAGQIGSSDRMEYTVIGDTVNLASRIEGLNKAFGTDILLTEETYRQISKTVKAVKMPAVTVKGKKDPLYVYAVLGSADDPDTPGDLSQLRKLLRTNSNAPAGEGVVLNESKYKVIE